jgi:1,4-alpha-glucan branching enzyme
VERQQHIGWPTGATGHCVFNSDWNGYSSDFGSYGGNTIYPSSGSYDGYSYHASISIAPYSALVYDIY